MLQCSTVHTVCEVGKLKPFLVPIFHFPDGGKILFDVEISPSEIVDYAVREVL